MNKSIPILLFLIWAKFSTLILVEPLLLQAQGTELFRDRGEVCALHYSGNPKELAAEQLKPSNWSKFKELSELTISHTRITRDLMDAVSEIRSLQLLELGIDSTRLGVVESGSLKPLGKLTQLKAFVLAHYYDDLKDSDFEFLSALQSLERFETSNHVSQSTFAKLSSLPNLQHLECWDLEGRDSDFESLSHNPNLRSINVQLVSNPTAMLAGLGRGIRDLSFGCRRLKTSDFEQLSDLTGIEKLRIEGEFESLPLDRLSFLKEMKTLYLFVKGGARKIELGTLKSSENLRLIVLKSQNKESRVTVSGLENHPNIEELHIPSLTITNKVLETLKTIPNLRSVVALNSQVEIGELKLQLPNCEISLEQE